MPRFLSCVVYVDMRDEIFMFGIFIHKFRELFEKMKGLFWNVSLTTEIKLYLIHSLKLAQITQIE